MPACGRRSASTRASPRASRRRPPCCRRRGSCRRRSGRCRRRRPARSRRSAARCRGARRGRAAHRARSARSACRGCPSSSRSPARSRPRRRRGRSRADSGVTRSATARSSPGGLGTAASSVNRSRTSGGTGRKILRRSRWPSRLLATRPRKLLQSADGNGVSNPDPGFLLGEAVETAPPRIRRRRVRSLRGGQPGRLRPARLHREELSRCAYGHRRRRAGKWARCRDRARDGRRRSPARTVGSIRTSPARRRRRHAVYVSVGTASKR